ncbi:V0D/AC39 family V-type ATPase subunit [Allochromatium palmeri]|uniref:ATPase n=1 Tax=Allochromatium palmeri TaxID=231048 RepID=A0A6N8EB47_9GAMM|nr:V-type ATPase subunit [Allochromatium palmeri]MTW20680.1 ATPase [Allochromatium palmeri]
MSQVADQAYLNTRVSVMATRLFDPSLIERLAHLPLAALADEFDLAALLDEHITPAVRRRAAEQSLIQLLLSELLILTRPMNVNERALVLDWGRKYALYNLKTLIRGKLRELDRHEINDNLFELPEHIRLPDKELFGAENVLELLRRLEVGPQRQIARQAREVYEQQREPFALEAAIDQRYFIGLVHRVQVFGAPHQEWLRRLISAELDSIGLIWLLRFRFTYRLSPSETYYWLVPSMRVLTRERLLRLVDLDSFEQVLDALPEPLRTRCADCGSIAEAQPRLARHAIDEIRLVLARSPSGVARALAYLMLRETDLLGLFAAIQGRLLGFDDRIIQHALTQIEPGVTGS